MECMAGILDASNHQALLLTSPYSETFKLFFKRHSKEFLSLSLSISHVVEPANIFARIRKYTAHF